MKMLRVANSVAKLAKLHGSAGCPISLLVEQAFSVSHARGKEQGSGNLWKHNVTKLTFYKSRPHKWKENDSSARRKYRTEQNLHKILN